MFGRKNKPLEQWFESLPSSFKRELANADIKEWNQLLVKWLGKQDSENDDKATPEDSLLNKAVKLAKESTVVSTHILMLEFNLLESRAVALLNKMKEEGYIEVKGSGPFHEVYGVEKKTTVDEAVIAAIFDHVIAGQSVSDKILQNKFGIDKWASYCIIESMQHVGLIESL